MIQQLVQPPISSAKSMGLKIGVVIPRYKLHRINTMFNRSYEVLREYGVNPEDIHVISVPDFYELATVVQKILARDSYDAIICYGPASWATMHPESSDGMDQRFQWVALYNNVPVIFGTPATENKSRREQIERGADFALTAIRLAQCTA